MRLPLLVTTSLLCTAAFAAKPALQRSTASVTMIFDAGGRGDRGFNDSANEGLLRATTELGVRSDVVESIGEASRSAELEKIIARKPDGMIAVGFLFAPDVVALAGKHPAQKFACIDCMLPSEKAPANVRAVSFRDGEGAFLAGALAAMTTKTGKIGFVGGMDSAVVHGFLDGYTRGAKHVSPKVQILVELAGTTPAAFTDPAKGKMLALKEYDAGADVIFHAAGATGLGVFDAAKERKKHVIGVDTDQWEQAPGLVLTSVVKRLDLAVFDAVKQMHSGAFKGGSVEMGLKDGGVSLVLDERNKGLVDDASRAKLRELQQAIVDGKLAVK